jgi:signal transduction histidine kinase
VWTDAGATAALRTVGGGRIILSVRLATFLLGIALCISAARAAEVAEPAFRKPASASSLAPPASAAAPASSPSTAPARAAQRVLMIHSFGSSAPPFTTHSTAFESAIKAEMGWGAVDLDEVSLDMARYANPDMEEAFAEFLAKRMSAWRPDLVVPIGSPAGRFVAKHRGRLFPAAPVVYTGMDRRTLPADALADNATFVGEQFDLAGLIEDMLQLDPRTDHVMVILGATPLERYWKIEFEKAFEPFAARGVRFTWTNDLSFEQIQERAATLPPHSFVLLGLLLRDAAGVSHNADAALARLHAVSRAPINGLYQNQVGLGIVGGRLYQGEQEGVEGARVAARILRGEPASSFPPMVIGTREPVYDWRELQRWRIDERRLPPGSIVLFRQPTAWQRYRWHVLAAAAVIATQAAFIVALVRQLRRRRAAEAARAREEDARRRAEAETQRKREELTHLSRVATLGELTATLTHEISQPLTAIMSNAGAAAHLLEGDRPDVPEVRAALADIGADTERAAEVLRRLRGMLKRDTPVGFAPVDLDELVRAVASIVRSDAVRHRVTVELDLACSRARAPGADAEDGAAAEARVTGDGVELQQVVLNLLLNAITAIDVAHASGASGGAGGLNGARRLVIVRTRRTDEGAALLEVVDTGTGIPPEKLDSIFEPFVTSKPDGLGMGLAICRSIVERHGGRIRATNNRDGDRSRRDGAGAGTGATFSITLPTVR